MQSPTQHTNGKHLLAEFYHCQCDSELLCQTEPMLTQLVQAIDSVELTLVGQAVHEFHANDAQNHISHNYVVSSNQQTSLPQKESKTTINDKEDTGKNTNMPDSQTSGITISLLLAESHLCLHTWGELRTVTLDIYVCNFLQDNSDKADQLLTVCQTIFQPNRQNVRTVWREHQL